jgi:outer membrane protein assembly factor BamE (lipoprotein component of BamABCDE complex)
MDLIMDLTMKKIFLLCVAVTGLMLLFSGCAYYEMQKNLDNSRKLRLNMTKEQVRAIMGEPIKGQAYTSENAWFYYTNTQWYDGRTTEDECLPLLFKNGKLVGWGWEYFEKARIQHKYAK